jgi:hypothetical protein
MRLFPLAGTVLFAAGFAYWASLVAFLQYQHGNEVFGTENRHLTRRARHVRLAQISGLCRGNLLDPLTSRS